MGFTKIQVALFNPQNPDGGAKLECLVDTGAALTGVPGSVLAKLGVAPVAERSFLTADGSRMTRAVGGALLEVLGQRSVCPVIFGEPNDMSILGVTALEALGFEVDPTTQQLKQVPLIQA